MIPLLPVGEETIVISFSSKITKTSSPISIFGNINKLERFYINKRTFLLLHSKYKVNKVKLFISTFLEGIGYWKKSRLKKTQYVIAQLKESEI